MNLEQPTLEQAPEAIAKDESLLGGYAYQVITRQAKRIFKLRSQVLADSDLEPLHQMRIGTRQMRSALILFADVIELDASKKEKKKKNTQKKLSIAKPAKSFKKLTQALGNVRDLDVMGQWFKQAIADHTADASRFSKKEKKAIHHLLKTLKKRRKKQFSKLKKALKSSTYKTLIGQFKQWEKQPAFSAKAQQSASRDAAERLVAPITELLQHPGWQVATQKRGEQLTPIDNITLAQLNQALAQDGARLHDLRKQIKRVRYQAEFFRGLYGITYVAQIREFRTLQKTLGQLQDQIVIGQFLAAEIGPDWAQTLPTLEANFQNSRLALWQQWQPYQRKYLKLSDALPSSQRTA